MKNKIIAIIGLILSVSFSSCTDWLNPKPLDTMVVEDFWKTRSDVESMTLACYEAMTQYDFMIRMIVGGEVRSDNVRAGNREPGGDYLKYKDALSEMLNVSIQPTNEFAKWEPFYKVINYCNSVIKYAPGVRELDPDYTEGYLNANMAEAYTIRALMYFYLVRLYNNVPFVTEPSVDDTGDFLQPQKKGEEILREVLKDLEIAERGAIRSRGPFWVSPGGSIMNPQNAVNAKGRVTKTAIRTLIADIYLWLAGSDPETEQADYAACIEKCNLVLKDVLTDEQAEYIQGDDLTGTELWLVSNKEYVEGSVSPAYYSIFGSSFGNSMESIFELQMNGTNDGRLTVGDLYGSDNQACWLYVSPFLNEGTETFDNTDTRKMEYYFQTDKSSTTSPIRIVKYVGRIRDVESPDFLNRTIQKNWIFYRLPEIYLMKAEAIIQSGGSLEEAFDLINIIYKRSNPTVKNGLSFDKYNSPEELSKLLLLERQREFLFEGKRWFDLLRHVRRDVQRGGSTSSILERYLVRKNSFNADVVTSKMADINAFYMPVHRDELISNSRLEQNPYYLNVFN
ncbi:MAG: RagB/SusD family nutrient uptake outer membrane protein [Dysgonamonadaceae bacterium]|jgi:hypothetical protein|nr:RagB/SusD family nutrient uptake outer membrane protein [Dysgonamonadaceae bacterium]